MRKILLFFLLFSPFLAEAQSDSTKALSETEKAFCYQWKLVRTDSALNPDEWFRGQVLLLGRIHNYRMTLGARQISAGSWSFSQDSQMITVTSSSGKQILSKFVSISSAGLILELPRNGRLYFEEPPPLFDQDIPH